MKTGRGKKELRDVIDTVTASDNAVKPLQVDYGEMEPFLRDIMNRLETHSPLSNRYPLRWMAIKLMEGGRRGRTPASKISPCSG